jgi:predicted Fe-S protein YdhL (DUF1289 family)
MTADERAGWLILPPEERRQLLASAAYFRATMAA